MAVCTAACADNRDEAAHEDGQAVQVGADTSVEAFVDRQALAELKEAVRATDNRDEVTIPGVLAIQNQYSQAVLRLDAPSWSTVTQSGELGAQVPVVWFPREGLANGEAYAASEAAAEKMFYAMVGAKESTVQRPAGEVTVRASSRYTFTCERAPQASRPKYRCSVAGVTSLGGPGLFWW